MEREREEVRRRAERDEKVRAALWRIDSHVAPLLAAESAWPLYGLPPPEEDLARTGWQCSRLLLEPPSDDRSTSAILDYAEVIARVPPARGGADGPGGRTFDYSNRLYLNHHSQQAVQQIAAFNLARLQEAPMEATPLPVPGMGLPEAGSAVTTSSEPLRPFWSGERLVLAARVGHGPQVPVRASVIAWDPLRRHLEGLVGDLLPGSALVPSGPDDEGRAAYRMASLPVSLTLSPEALEFRSAASGGLRAPLIAAWAGILAGVAALGALLAGILSLSERRRRFVSSVTHELRTPLTTFQLYSEMLRDGMVPEEHRGEYLETLRRESVRLQHLVENVLAYARLERRGLAGRTRPMALDALIRGMEDRLAARAAEAGMELYAAVADPEAVVQADPSAVEQILFNLVDNACKYAAGGTSPRIELSAAADGRCVLIRVRDHGPGFSAPAWRLVRPFAVSAEEAARRSCPGVGLGLELSRRLARAQGGSLRVERPRGAGACVVLALQKGARAADGAG